MWIRDSYINAYRMWLKIWKHHDLTQLVPNEGHLPNYHTRISKPTTNLPSLWLQHLSKQYSHLLGLHLSPKRQKKYMFKAYHRSNQREYFEHPNSRADLNMLGRVLLEFVRVTNFHLHCIIFKKQYVVSSCKRYYVI